jgi:hypothetical protein
MAARRDGFFSVGGVYTGNVQFGSTLLQGAGGLDGFLESFLFVPDTPAPPRVDVGPDSATVTVDPIAGGTVSEYQATARPGDSRCRIVAPATSCTITGLIPGVSYAISVVAINPAGASQESSSVTAATAPGASPAEPAQASAALPAPRALGPLSGRVWRVGTQAITAGPVPVGATSVWQSVARVAPGRTRVTGVAARPMRACSIQGPSWAQRYRCVQRLAPGTWRLVTEARATGLQPVSMRSRVLMRAGSGPAVTG